jgi:hypothetical protein
MIARSGMSLVELTAASVLLAALALVTVAGLGQLHAQRRLVWEEHVAREAVANALEIVDSWSFAQADERRVRSFVESLPPIEDLPGARFSVDVREQKVSGLAARRLRVSLEWNRSRSGATFSVQTAIWKFSHAS